MSQHRFTAATALAEAARSIHQTRSLEETLGAIVHAATASVPGFDQIGISISQHSGEIETKSATGQLVWDLDAVQYSLMEGPCVDAIRKQPVVAVNDLRHDQRWPRYVPEAVAQGVRSQLAFRLYSDEKTLGGMNLYSTESDTIPDDAPQMAELFAAHATIALDRAIQEDSLNIALSTRGVIGQAIGLTMEHYHVDSTRAFQFLTRVSSTSNIKLRDIAQEVVDQANDRYAADLDATST
jgi:GAF domain-containing protein